MKDRYAVIGNPIEHSLSPQIHTAFAEQTGQDMEYLRILGEPERFAAQLRAFFGTGGRGLNVTVPFKEEAWELSEERSDRAEAAGAVNTLILQRDGSLLGDNTDGVGLVRDLTVNQGFALKGRRILLLGAGGAARGVVRPLLHAEVLQLVVANRTPARAQLLVRDLAAVGQAEGCGLDDLHGRRFDLIINATASGLGGKVPQVPDRLLVPGGWCYDLMYGSEPTPFVRWGRSQGASQSLDGLGMLVEQAAESFWLWRGVRPDTGPVIQMLRSLGAPRKI